MNTKPDCSFDNLVPSILGTIHSLISKCVAVIPMVLKVVFCFVPLMQAVAVFSTKRGCNSGSGRWVSRPLQMGEDKVDLSP